MINNYFKIALRNILKNKLYSFINISGLAVGLACTILIFTWIEGESKIDDFHRNKDNIYRVVVELEHNSQASLCGALGPALEEELPEVVDYTRIWSGWISKIGVNNNFIKANARFADPSIFDLFSFPLLKGNAKTALVENHSIVITEEIADKLFPDGNALGKIVQIKNRKEKKENFTIKGIAKNVPKNSHIQFDILYSYNLLNEWYREGWGGQWSNFSFINYIKTEPNVNQDSLSAKITACFNRHKDKKRTLYAEPLKEVYLNAKAGNLLGPSGNDLYISIFRIIGVLLLFVACINYMNLSTAKAFKRIKEIALRKVIGAAKREIIFQNLRESFLLTFISIPLTTILLIIFKPFFEIITNKPLLFHLNDYQFVLTILLVVFSTALISGSYPAFYLSGFSPTELFSKRRVGGKYKASFRKGLVVTQFIVTLIVIVAAMVTNSQLNFIQNKNLGFEKENLLYAWVPGTNNEILKSELLKNSNVISAGASGAQLNWLGWWQGINKWTDKKDDEYYSFGILEVGYDYLDTYKMQISEGRYFSRKFPTDNGRAVVVNEAAIKKMGIENPVGKYLTFAGKEREIVGVVKDFHFESLYNDIDPLIMYLYPQKLGCLGIRIKGQNPTETIEYIASVFRETIKDEAIEIQFLDDQLQNQYKADEVRSRLFQYFSIITMFLAMLGLIGLASFSVERRQREIGIKKVYGASVQKIVKSFTLEYLIWVIIAAVIAIPLSYIVMDKWLDEFAFRIDMEIQTFIMSIVLVLCLTWITVLGHAIKASYLNPIDVLKSE